MKRFTKGILLIFCITFVLAVPMFTRAAPGDPWVDQWHDSEGNTFYVRRAIIISDTHEAINTPIQITPYFEDGHCWPTTIRIVGQNSTSSEYIETPYVFDTPVVTYTSGYAKNTSITFVAHNSRWSYYIYYSDNDTITAPDYTGRFLSVTGNKITNFYDADSHTLVQNRTIRLPKNDNGSADILIPVPSAGKFVEIEQAKTNLTAYTTFSDSDVYLPKTLTGSSPGMGPNSIRLYRGDTFPNGANVSEPYLLVGNSYGLGIYRYKNASKSFEYENGVAIPGLGPQGWTVSGIQISDAHRDGASRLVSFGLTNGTVMFYSYDGSTFDYLTRTSLYANPQNLSDPSNPGTWSKPFGVASADVNTDNAFQELFLMAQGPYDNLSLSYEFMQYDAGQIIRFNYTSPRFGLGEVYDASVNNWSALAFSQTNYAWNEFENWFTANSINEVLYCYVDSQEVRMQMIEFQNKPFSNATGYELEDRPRAKDSNNNNKITLVPGIAPSLAYSKKLSSDSSTYKIISAGSSGKMVIKTYELDNKHAQSGEFLLVKELVESSIEDNNIQEDRAFMPVTGNFDNINSTYDDVLIVDNMGDYHYVIYDTNNNSLVKVRSASLFGTYKDLYGSGQSVLTYDLDGNGVDEVILVDSDGVLHVLEAADPTDVKAYVKTGPGANDYFNQASFDGRMDYYNSEHSFSGFEQRITDFIGNDTLNHESKTYSKFNLKLSSTEEADVMLHSLNITFTTNDYLLMDVNRDMFAVSTSVPLYADLNGDGLCDFFVLKGRFYCTSALRAHLVNEKCRFTWNNTIVELGQGDEFPAGFNYLSFMLSADADGDGLLNGWEMVIHGTDPLSADTDNDGLTDGEEINTYLTNPLNPDSDNDGLTDGEEVNTYLSNPLNNNTCGDSVTIQGRTWYLLDGEKVALGLNPLKNDTDDDGLTDLEELGLYDITKPNALKHYSKTQKSMVFYAKNDIFFKQLGYTESSLGGKIVYGLDPTKYDTDGDHLSDKEEIFGSTVGGVKYYSNPTMNDTDGDGLADGVELFGWNVASGNRTEGVLITHASYEYYKADRVDATRLVILDPDNWDTDNDKLSDYDEIMIWESDPTNPSTVGDGILDGDKVNGLWCNGELCKLNPSLWDNDGDGLGDAEEYHGCFVNRDGSNGTYFDYWGSFGRRFQTNPLLVDTDGDGWTDLEELTIYNTDPTNNDTSGDGILDSESEYPHLHIAIAKMSLYISYIAVGASVVSIVLNQRSLKVLKKRIIQDKDRKQSLARMENERLGVKNFDLKISLIPTDNADLFKVRMTIKILEESFFAKAAKIYYSALDVTNQELDLTPLGNESFAVTLDDLPIDTQVMFYLSVLNKSGAWVNDDNDGKLYRFITTRGGKLDTSDEDDWDVKRGVKCQVCGYLCLREWDECPNCNSPLHSVLQEVLQDDQVKKEEQRKREQDLDAIAWEDAQVTDDVWRGLPTCPQCGSAVQPDWAACPICSYNLEGIKLEKKALFADEEVDMDYIEGSEEIQEEKYVSDLPEEEQPKSAKQIKEEMELKRKKQIEKEWGKSDDNADIL